MVKTLELFGGALKINIGSDGSIYTLDHSNIRKNGKADNRKGRKLKPKIDRDGYEQITLTTNGVRKTFTTHRLVAMAFIPNPENKPTVNHINGNKVDNRVENLEWNTHKEQKEHSIKNNLCINNINALEQSNKNKSIKIIIDEIEYNSIREAQRILKISRYSVLKRRDVIPHEQQ